MPLDAIDPHKTAVLLDVDGTILDIAPTPHEVRVPDTLRGTLTRVAGLLGGALALVSGRPIGDLDFIFAPLRLAVAGGHGAEIRPDPNGGTFEQRASSLNRDLKQTLAQIAGRHQNVGFEDKGYSVALHYRLALDDGLNVVDEVFQACKPYPLASYELLTGKAVIEVKSPGFDKGSAVRELMTYRPFQGRMPIFIGDDTTDEAAFAVMPEFNGLAISVGRKVPGVSGRFQTPQDVRQWLERLASEMAVAS